MQIPMLLRLALISWKTHSIRLKKIGPSRLCLHNKLQLWSVIRTLMNVKLHIRLLPQRFVRKQKLIKLQMMPVKLLMRRLELAFISLRQSILMLNSECRKVAIFKYMTPLLNSGLTLESQLEHCQRWTRWISSMKILWKKLVSAQKAHYHSKVKDSLDVKNYSLKKAGLLELFLTLIILVSRLGLG